MVRAILIAAGLACVPGVALADIIPYTPRVDPVRGVVAGDTASMSLVMVDALNRSVTINTEGEKPVVRGGAPISIGANRNGGGNILASWDEVVQGQSTFINAIFRTSDGSMFMPPTAQVNGQPAFFWTWHFGSADAVSYMDWVTQVQLLSAQVLFSDNGGQSFSSVHQIAGLGGSFLNGVDNGNYLATIGDGTNYIMLRYQIAVVPAPAGMGVIAGGALLAVRRRRR